MKLEPIFIKSGGYKRHIGDIDKIKKIFYKQVNSEKHKFRVLNAYKRVSGGNISNGIGKDNFVYIRRAKYTLS